MKYSIPQAAKKLCRLLKKACAGEEVVIACKELRVKLVPVCGPEMASANKDRVPGRLKGKIFCAPNAFDPLTDRELSDLGFE